MDLAIEAATQCREHSVDKGVNVAASWPEQIGQITLGVTLDTL